MIPKKSIKRKNIVCDSKQMRINKSYEILSDNDNKTHDILEWQDRKNYLWNTERQKKLIIIEIKNW